MKMLFMLHASEAGIIALSKEPQTVETAAVVVVQLVTAALLVAAIGSGLLSTL